MLLLKLLKMLLRPWLKLLLGSRLDDLRVSLLWDKRPLETWKNQDDVKDMKTLYRNIVREKFRMNWL